MFLTDYYERALADGEMDVAYSRVMFLGTAGVGKTSFKRSLMKELWDPSTINSTIVSDVQSIRPIGYELQSLGYHENEQWREVTEDDEVQEMAELLVAVHNESGVKELRTKSKAVTELFPVLQFDTESSLEDTESIECLEQTHVESVFSKAVNRAQFITIRNITPQPFVHIWDCGGQPVFLEILPAFLTSRTMFLLLYDASKSFHEKWKSVQTVRGERKEVEEVNMTTLDLLHNWLSNIHIHLAKYDKEGAILDYPRVLCIGTHGDKLKRFRQSKKKSAVNDELKSHCRGKPFETLIDDFYIVDNTTAGKGKDEDPNFSKIRGKIYDFTSGKLIVKTPISWVLFRKVIGSIGKNVISLKEACGIGKACKIPAEVVPSVLLFYHDLGVLLFYPHIKSLQDTVIISSKWFVNALGKVLTLQGREEHKTRLMWDLLHEKGILVQPLYVAAWREVEDITPQALIELLVHFCLAAEVKTDQFYDPDVKQYFLPLVLPSFLPSNSQLVYSEGHLQRATPLHLTFHTRFVPPGFFTRLITSIAESPHCKIQFDKGVYRNKIHILFGNPPCDDVVLMELLHAIQVDVLRYVPESDSLDKFAYVCQELHKYLVQVAKDVDCCLFGSSDKCKVFKEVRFLCASATCAAVGPHYLHHSQGQTCDLHIKCDNDNKYRQVLDKEGFWFLKTKTAKEVKLVQIC